MNIKTPPPVSADILKMAFGRALLRNGETISQLVDFASALQSARDQQWIEMVRPLIYSANKAEDLLRMFLSHQTLTSDQFKDALRGLQAALSQIKGE